MSAATPALAPGGTRLDHAPALARALGAAAILVKREDLLAPGLPGNKVRTLARLLASPAALADGAVALGPSGSNWARAVLAAGTAAGVPVDLVLWRGQANPAGRAALAAAAPRARAFCECSLLGVAAALLSRIVRRRRPTLWLPGGAGADAVRANATAALEVVAAARAGLAPLPDVVYVPHGTGSTVAGVALGFALAGAPTEVVAVRVTSAALANRFVLRWLLARTRRACTAEGRPAPAVALPRVEGRQYGRGYGMPTDASRAAADLAADALGVRPDPTYGAKTLAALVADGRAGRLDGRTACLWLTLAEGTP